MAVWRFTRSRLMVRMVVLAAMFIGLASAVGQPPERIYSPGVMPSGSELDRLNLTVGWRVQLPAECRRDGIAVVRQQGDQLFVQLRNGSLYVLAARTGELQWSMTPESRYAVTRRLGLGIDHVYHLDGNIVTALDRTNGSTHWMLELPEVPIVPPTSGELLLYVPFTNRRLLTYALPEAATKIKSADKASKERGRRWIEEFRKVAATAPVSGAGLNPHSSIIDFRGRTTTATGLGSRSASSSAAMLGRGEIREAVRTGATAMNQPLLVSTQSPNFRIENPVIVSPLGVLVTGKSREVLFLRRDPERPIFRFSLDNSINRDPVVYGDVAYFATEGGVLQAVNLVNGLVLWRYPAGTDVIEPLVVTTDALYIADLNAGVTRLDPELGQLVWTQPEAKRFLAANAKFVYAVNRLGKLLVLDRAQGTILSQADFSTFNVPIVNDTDDRLILASNDGWIVSLHDVGQPDPRPHAAPTAPAAPKTSDGPPKAPAAPPKTSDDVPLKP